MRYGVYITHEKTNAIAKQADSRRRRKLKVLEGEICTSSSLSSPRTEALKLFRGLSAQLDVKSNCES